MWVRSLGQEEPLEKEMATRSSILARINPWTGEPGRLQSPGSQRKQSPGYETSARCVAELLRDAPEEVTNYPPPLHCREAGAWRPRGGSLHPLPLGML